ncbi:hypothetical protein GCM10022286_03370 [Gryllotalpicola daejeonensis]|uniref:Uncharacterized protein n=1 Tax=Gryllotalpicola daejeonensis TaxID=993087 RepID=A0ABP7ZE85_9MICO
MKKLLSLRVLAPSVALGVIAGVVLWFVGAPGWWAVATGLVAAAAIALWRGHPSLEEPIWGKLTGERGRGARDDVQVLGWAVADLRGHIQPRALERVRGVARDRLAQRGLDLDAASDRPAIEALIGRRAYATLHSDVAHMPSQAALLASLDALDRVGLPGAARH